MTCEVGKFSLLLFSTPFSQTILKCNSLDFPSVNSRRVVNMIAKQAADFLLKLQK